MSKTRKSLQVNDDFLQDSLRLVAIRNIPLVITIDPITDKTIFHRPKRCGEVFDFPKKHALALIKRKVALRNEENKF